MIVLKNKIEVNLSSEVHMIDKKKINLAPFFMTTQKKTAQYQIVEDSI